MTNKQDFCLENWTKNKIKFRHKKINQKINEPVKSRRAEKKLKVQRSLMCLCSFACSVCRFVADFVKTPRRVVKKNLRPDQCTTYLFEPYGTLKSPSARKPLLFSGTSLHSLLDQSRSLLVLESHQDWIISNSLLNIYNLSFFKIFIYSFEHRNCDKNRQ